jgi:hypothetical protein
MGFKSPKRPRQPKEAPPPPTIDEAVLGENESRRLLARRGRLSTILTGPRGLTRLGTVASKQLLGE